MSQRTRALQIRKAVAQMREQCFNMGHQNGALLYIYDVTGGRLAKTHRQLLRFRFITQAQARPAAISPGLPGDNLIHLMLHQTRQRSAFAALL
ncbi:hypothetical protein D3C78_1361380 [compost metagenome]